MDKVKDVEEKTISLAGTWSISLPDKDKVNISLPGSVTEQGLGSINDKSELFFLSEKRKFVGEAIFERSFFMPEYVGCSVMFSMERTRVTSVEVNGHTAGHSDMLTTTQYFDITDLVHEGKNRISVVVDNTFSTIPREPVLGSHMATEHTQTNWNGILGEIKIQVIPDWVPFWIRVYPDAAKSEVKMQMRMNKTIQHNTKEVIHVEVRQPQYDSRILAETDLKSESNNTENTILVRLNNETPLWSEFSPKMTSIVVDFVTKHERYRKKITFGLRNYRVSDDRRHFAVNGKKTFIRSETNCCVFPTTGYAPMNEKDWDRLFDTYLDYGVNYVRFHSWCPPEAAFESADKKGLYLQVELSEWTFHTFEKDSEFEYYSREAKTILDQYGNHPSLVAMTWGNELRSDNRARMGELCRIMRKYDNTRLYAEGSNTWYGLEGVNEESDFVIAQGNFTDDWRGAYAGNRGFINDNEPGECQNYSDVLKNISMPVISFEVGQFQSYPDYKEIDKYKGVLEARNLMAYREKMNKNGMGGMDEQFQKASGRLSMMCYREEIEAAMRTPCMAGISLLGLQDFPGQGTALIGMIDSFGTPKKFSVPSEFHSFFSPVTPLLFFQKYCVSENENVEFTVFVHNFGKDSLHDPVTATIADDNGCELSKHIFNPEVIKQGFLSTIGTLHFCVPEKKDKMPYVLTANVEVAEYSNNYAIYVFPKTKEIDQSCVINCLDKTARARLKKGENLILLPDLTPGAIPTGYPMSYIADFWCWVMFQKWDPSGTMGIIADPNDHIWKNFPTDIGTDQRWWHLLHGSRAICLNGTGIHPLLGVIDNIQRADELGLVFEARVENGKLLVATLNMGDEKDCSVRSFIKDIYDYIHSESFNPTAEISFEKMNDLIPGKRENLATNAMDCNESWCELKLDGFKCIDTVQVQFVVSDVYATNGTQYELPGKYDILVSHNNSWKPVTYCFRNGINSSSDNICRFEKETTDAVRIVFGSKSQKEVNVMATEQDEEKPIAVEKVWVFGTEQ